MLALVFQPLCFSVGKQVVGLLVQIYDWRSLRQWGSLSLSSLQLVKFVKSEGQQLFLEPCQLTYFKGQVLETSIFNLIHSFLSLQLQKRSFTLRKICYLKVACYQEQQTYLESPTQQVLVMFILLEALPCWFGLFESSQKSCIH